MGERSTTPFSNLPALEGSRQPFAFFEVTSSSRRRGGDDERAVARMRPAGQAGRFRRTGCCAARPAAETRPCPAPLACFARTVLRQILLPRPSRRLPLWGANEEFSSRRSRS